MIEVAELFNVTRAGFFSIILINVMNADEHKQFTP